MSGTGTANNSDLIALDGRAVWPRTLFAAAAILTMLLTFVGVRWQLGNTLATLTPPADPNAVEIGELATKWAPGDPFGYAFVAATADPSGAVRALEGAVRRAPNDFRWRIDLGRAYEQDGRPEDAETEFRKAVELAPNHSSPRWSLGNFLLRAERTDDAFAELRIAAAQNQLYRDEVFSLLWDYSNKDASRLVSLAGDSPELISRLAYFFAARGQATEALENWKRLPAEFRKPDIAKSIALGLFEKQYFREALAFSQDYGAESTSSAGSVTNPSFDEPLLGDETLFGWRIMRTDPKIDVTADSRVNKEGTRSLRITFKGNVKLGFANAFQTIVVAPGSRYRLSAWVRTENLRSAGLPVLEIINPATAARLAASRPFTAGSSDWEAVSAEFAVPPDSTAITIRTVRVDCGEDCPITGIVWYDGFRLEKL